MKISVIIPCFNEEKYLPTCLDSLLLQTLKPNEIIICDNNSKDDTINIAKSYQNKLPIKVIHQSIQGIMPTVEKAWRESSGDIIVKTDADAVLPKDWINNTINHFISDPKLAACGGNWVPYQETLFWTYLGIFALWISDLIMPLAKGYKFLLGPNMALRRTTYEKINGYITDDTKIVDDQLISYKLKQNGLKYQKFADCWNYHSGRQFHKGIKHLFIYGMSSFFPQLYPQKVT